MIRRAAAYAVAAGIGSIVGTLTGTILGVVFATVVMADKNARDVVVTTYQDRNSSRDDDLRPQDANLPDVDLTTPPD